MKYLICNLKAHKTYQEMLFYREEILNLRTNTKLILAPSNLYLSLFKGSNILLCAQNIDLEEEAELTGDTSIKQLKSMDVKYSIIGHYERKKSYNESEYDIINKIKNALKKDLKVIYCIGETKEELDRKIEFQVLERSIARVLNNIDPKDFKNIILAYEPAYLIGQNTTYNIEKLQTNINFIKTIVKDYYGVNIDLVFGGNINKENIDDFLSIQNLDGFILGNGCLNPDHLKQIANKL